MNEEKPNYYAVIPSRIRYDDDLVPNEKLLYGEITALTNKNGECWATNKYFSELYKVHVNTVSNWIQHLKLKGYIDTKIIYKNGTKEIEKRILKINGNPINENVKTYQQNYGEGINENVERGINKNVEENNTSINNTSLIIKENIKRKFFENDEVNNLFNEFLDFRKKLKAVNSEKAIQLLINKLNLYDDSTKKQMINNSIENSWKSVYPIKKQKKENNITDKDLEEIEKKYASK